MPTIPPWFSEQLPLTYELALEIGKFRKELAEKVAKDIAAHSPLASLKKGKLAIGANSSALLDAMPIDQKAKKALYTYFVEQILFAKTVPNDKLIVIEITKDVGMKRNYVVFHSLFGRRINDALSRLFAIEFSEYFESEVGIMVNDNGFVIVLDEDIKVSNQHIAEIIEHVVNEDIADVLKRNVRRTEMMKRRFRHCAVRGFMVLRNYKGKKISVRKQQVNSEALLSAAEEISPDFPIIKETYREILEDVMDMPRAKEIIKSLKNGDIKYQIIETPVPSPFSHIMLTFGEADIVMMKDRRKHLRELRKYVLSKIKAK